MRRFGFVMVLAFVMSFICLAGAARAADVIKLKFANYYHPTHRNAILAGQFCEEIKKRTNGRVEISYLPGGTLATHPKMAQAVLTGVADIGYANFAATRGRFPVSEALDLPHGFPSSYVSTHVANEFYNKFKPKEWDNLHVLFFHACGPNVVYTTKTAVNKLDDMSGLKLRAVSRVADVVKALGAVPMPVEMADIYESLNKGVVQGAYGPFEQIGGYKLAEVVKYATPALPVGSVFTFYVVMNKKKWDSLPADVQKIFGEVSAEWIEKQAHTWDDIDMQAIQYFKKEGGKLHMLSGEEWPKWKKAVVPVFEEYTRDMTKRGFKKTEIDSWNSFIQERIAFWHKKQKEQKVKTPY